MHCNSSSLFTLSLFRSSSFYLWSGFFAVWKCCRNCLRGTTCTEANVHSICSRLLADLSICPTGKLPHKSVSEKICKHNSCGLCHSYACILTEICAVVFSADPYVVLHSLQFCVNKDTLSNVKTKGGNLTDWSQSVVEKVQLSYVVLCAWCTASCELQSATHSHSHTPLSFGFPAAKAHRRLTNTLLCGTLWRASVDLVWSNLSTHEKLKTTLCHSISVGLIPRLLLSPLQHFVFPFSVIVLWICYCCSVSKIHSILLQNTLVYNL